jgi:hypothetical protein
MSESAVTSPSLYRRPASADFLRPALPRLLLIAGCVLAVAMAAWLGQPQASAGTDPDLLRLLRGMAMIKGFLVLAAVGVLLWRFGHPLSPGMAGAYLVGAWLAAGASMMIWQLTLIPLAALVFHVGEITMLVTAWRDHKSDRTRT